MRLIDADEAIKKAECYDWDTTAINNAPTVDAKPIVKGKWMKTYIYSASGDKPALFYCSECNMCVPFPTPYCPFCGTSMLGERRYDGDSKC